MSSVKQKMKLFHDLQSGVVTMGTMARRQHGCFYKWIDKMCHYLLNLRLCFITCYFNINKCVESLVSQRQFFVIPSFSSTICLRHPKLHIFAIFLIKSNAHRRNWSLVLCFKHVGAQTPTIILPKSKDCCTVTKSLSHNTDCSHYFGRAPNLAGVTLSYLPQVTLQSNI